MKLSVVVPARNESASVGPTVDAIADTLERAGADYEILVIDDHSTDDTRETLGMLTMRHPTLRWCSNVHPPGFGNAIRTGLEGFAGDAVAIMMADGSDDPSDLLRYLAALDAGFDCAFGSRFVRGARVVDYPAGKRVLNRLANHTVNLLFGLGYTDVTNAFKCYRRHVVAGIGPILSRHFNVTVELPLKAIVRGYSWTVVPTNWFGRTAGTSKFMLREMGSRYTFIVAYVLLERLLVRQDYQRRIDSEGDTP